MFYRYIMHTMQIFTCVCRGAMIMRVPRAYGHLTSIPGSHRPWNSGWKPEFNLLTRGNLCSHVAILCWALYIIRLSIYKFIVEYIIIIIISIHEFRPGWPVSVSAVISSRSLLSGRPGRRLPFG
jgi:hypothetical protein